MNQNSSVGFGTDANILAAYAHAANDRLGNFDLVVENTGANTLYLQVREHDGVTSPSGYANLGAAFTVVPRGTVTRSYLLLSKQIGFFGSGNTTANISTAIRNPADLRGAQIDIVVQGRTGWGFDNAFDKKAFRSPGWGPFPDNGNPEA